MNPEVEDTEKVIEIGSQALKYQCMVMPVMGVNLLSNMSFQATRKKWLATLLSICRQGIFFIPLVFILPSLFNVRGVELVQPVSDLLTCIFSIPFFVHFLKNLK